MRGTFRTNKNFEVSYDDFYGVDLLSPITKVPRGYSDDAVNCYVNSRGIISSRWNYESLLQFGGSVTGLFGVVINGEDKIFVVSSGTLCLVNDNFGGFTEISSGFSKTSRTTAFSQGGCLWLIDGQCFRRLTFESDGSISVVAVSAIAYIPTTSIGGSGVGSADNTDTRVDFEGVNLLTPKRRNSFMADGVSTSYQLDEVDIDSTGILVTVNDVIISSSSFNVNYQKGLVTFSNPPASSEILGRDNLVITFSKTDNKDLALINGATTFGIYGEGGDRRVFLTGNRSFPSYDFYCDFNNPCYFPKENISIIGSGDESIVGYLDIGSKQGIITASSNIGDSTVYLRSVTDGLSGDIGFSTQAAVYSYSGVSPFAITNFKDEALFLTTSGIYSIVSRGLGIERGLVSKSDRINTELLTSKTYKLPLSAYQMISFRDFLLVTDGQDIYVGDNRQTLKSDTFNWYRWENIKAQLLFVLSDRLYFVDSAGRLCRFNNDNIGLNNATATFSTCLDDDSMPMSLKQIAKDDIYLEIDTLGASAVVTIAFDDKTSINHTIPSGITGIRELFIPIRGMAYKRLKITITGSSFLIYSLTKRFNVIGNLP